LFRLGGEEFLVVLPGCDMAEAVKIAERLRAALEGAQMLEGGNVTLSAGVAVCEDGDAWQALKAADQALYRAKQGGRNRVEADATGWRESGNAKAPPFGGALLPLWAAAPHGSGAKSTP